MLALVISINGKEILIAGEQTCELLQASIFAMRKRNAEESEYHIDVSGLPEQHEQGKHEHLRWPPTRFNVGDEILIRLTDSSTADPPLKRDRSDSKVQESPYTAEEIREKQWQMYLFLKNKFEGEASAD